MLIRAFHGIPEGENEEEVQRLLEEFEARRLKPDWHHWLELPLWTLGEAVCLFHDFNPNAEEIKILVESLPLYRLAIRSVECGRLEPTKPENDGLVTPRGFVRWLETTTYGRFMPKQLQALHDAYLEGDPSDAGDSATKQSEVIPELHAKSKELILGAALAVLATWPEDCRNQKTRKLSAKTIVDLIIKKSRSESAPLLNQLEFLPHKRGKEHGLPMHPDNARKLIRKWMARARVAAQQSG